MDEIDFIRLEDLAQIVAGAGRALLSGERREGLVLKEDGSPVTAADRFCEAAIAKALSALAPGLIVIGEESAPADGRLPDASILALVDPLDGTRAYIDGRDDFCVNLAIVKDGEARIGIIGAPARGAVYAGSIGAQGARCWRADVRADGGVASPTPLATRIPARKSPIALVSDRHGDEGSARLLDRLEAFERIALSSALKFTFLAEGAADLYPRLAPTMVWDTAAGQAILAAAGGATLDASGKALRYPAGGDLRNPGFIAAGDPELCAAAARFAAA